MRGAYRGMRNLPAELPEARLRAIVDADESVKYY